MSINMNDIQSPLVDGLTFVTLLAKKRTANDFSITR